MKLHFNDLIYSFSFGLDCIEHELLGVSNKHGMRVACMCSVMGRFLGFDDDVLCDLAACAVLHDNALTQYIQSEWNIGTNIIKSKEKISYGEHCIMGESNLKNLPFKTNVKDTILYHHENANGTGPFRKISSEVPVLAQIIHIADQVDAKWNLNNTDDQKINSIYEYVQLNQNILFSSECVNAFLCNEMSELLIRFKTEKPKNIIKTLLPDNEYSYTYSEIVSICDVFAKIVDYKSEFTSHHSIGVAAKAAFMGSYYGYDKEQITELYFAGAMHDIGKLAINRDILEKPDKLTDAEFKDIQTHAYYTYKILGSVSGLGEIVDWASYHHEKLNGKGYPFRKNANELNKNERLMCCIYIYQALTEKRPYKAGMSHETAIEIMNKMASDGYIDEQIVLDISNALFGKENIEITVKEILAV